MLIVDDQSAICKLICEVLSDKFEIKVVNTGEEALIINKQFKPNVILLDIGLPGMDGINVLPQLKDVNPNSNIVMLTGNCNDKLLNKALGMGAIYWIKKPFDILEMRKQIIKFAS